MQRACLAMAAVNSAACGRTSRQRRSTLWRGRNGRWNWSWSLRVPLL